MSYRRFRFGSPLAGGRKTEWQDRHVCERVLKGIQALAKTPRLKKGSAGVHRAAHPSLVAVYRVVGSKVYDARLVSLVMNVYRHPEKLSNVLVSASSARRLAPDSSSHVRFVGCLARFRITYGQNSGFCCHAIWQIKGMKFLRIDSFSFFRKNL
jgi:hypothetical protein